MLLRDGVAPEEVDALILSHLHPDHWSGIPSLVMAWGLADRGKDATIYLPHGSRRFIEETLRFSWLEVRERRYSLECVEYGSDHQLRPEGFSITAHPTSHLDKYRHQERAEGLVAPAFSLSIVAGETTILATQDLGSEDDIVDLLPGHAILICEAAHVDVASVISMAADCGVEKLIFTHIPPDVESVMIRLGSSPKRKGSPSVFVATDGFSMAL